MLSGRRVCLFLALCACLPVAPQPANAQSPDRAVRVLVRVRPVLAANVEQTLPLGDMSLTPAPSGNSVVDAFMGRHLPKKLAPLYPEVVRLKKRQGLSESEIDNAIRQKFPRRASRLRAAFQPPELSRTYVLEWDATFRPRLAEILKALRGDPDVESAEEDKVVSANILPNDPYLSSSGSWGQPYDDLWGIKKIGSPVAWNTSTGAGIIVAVVDTGIDYNHPDIASNVWINTKEIPGNGIDDDHNGFIDDVRGWDFIGPTVNNPTQSNDPIDHFGHGTHVAGTIAAVGDNGIGVIGVAWNAQVMAVKGLDDQGQGLDSTLAEAILYAANNGADVINASWGGPGYSQTLADAINYAYNLGVVIVVAAGNDEADARQFYPAAFWDVITVAATDPDDEIASFSNSGSKIDVAAPGVDILSLQAAGTQLGPVVSSGYIRLSGTSMAAPHASGLAALVLAQNTGFSNEDVRQVLRTSAMDLGAPGYDLTYGYGRINASAAVGVPSVLEAKISSPADGTVTQGVLSISGVARGNGFSQFTLDYGSGALPTSWTTITTSATPAAGTLGLFDTTSLQDGLYDLRLTVLDTTGHAFTDRIQIVLHTIFILSPVVPSAPTAPTTYKNGSVIPITGTAIAANFQNYVLEWAPGLDASSGWQTTGVTLTAGGLSPVTNAPLGNWDTSAISATGYYTIRLTVTSSAVVRRTITMAYLEPDLLSSNWPQLLDQGAYFSAGIVPASNADGSLRLVAEGPGNGAGVGEIWTLTPSASPVQTLMPGSGSYQQPAIADLDGNPGEEAAVADSNGIDVLAADGKLSQRTTTKTLDYTRSQIVVEDIAGDSHWQTLALGSDYENKVAYVSAWRPDGSLLSSNFPIRIPDQNPVNTWFNRARVLAADIDGDGKKEIIVQEGLSSTGFALGLFASDGTPRTWSVPAVLSGLPEAMVAADLDHNGKLETILVSYSGSSAAVDVFQPDGTERLGWPFIAPNLDTSSQSFLAVGDLNQDGRYEIVYSHESYLYVFNADGTIFSSAWPLLTNSTGVGYGAVVIGDVDGDGYPEIVTILNSFEHTSDPFFETDGYNHNQLQAIRRDGTLSKSWELTGRNGFAPRAYAAPAIGDFNRDGVTDIAVTYELTGSPSSVPGVVTILSTGAKFDPTKNDWPFIHQNPQNTGVLQNRTAYTSSTVTSLAASASSAVFGQPVTISAAVSPQPNPVAGSVPTGQVQFAADGVRLASCVLASATCSYERSSVSAGPHLITGQYLGDSRFTVSASPSLSLQIDQANTTNVVLSSANPSVTGQSVTLTAAVSVLAPGGGTPTGAVSFNDGSTSLGASPLDASGRAMLTITNFGLGTHDISATYAGDPNFAGSASSVADAQIVNPADFTLSGGMPQTVGAGFPASFTITVSPNPSPYNFAVTDFTCSGLPRGAACEASPASITPGARSATETLLITTSSRTLALVNPRANAFGLAFGFWLAAGLAGLSGLVFLPNKGNLHKGSLLVVILAMAAAFALGCASGSSLSSSSPNPDGTPQGSYTVTVSAVGNGNASHTTTVALNVN